MFVWWTGGLPDGFFRSDEVPGETRFLPDGQGPERASQGDVDGSVTQTDPTPVDFLRLE